MTGIEWGIHFIAECVIIFIKGLIGFSIIGFIISLPCLTIDLFTKKEK